MCIGVPMRIEGVDGVQAHAVAEATDGTVERHLLDMMIVGPQPPGTWVLVFHGAARRVLDAREALQIRDALSALQMAVDGEAGADASRFDALFADLVDRSPQLPEHLRRH